MPSPRSTRKQFRPRGRHAGESRCGVLALVYGLRHAAAIGWSRAGVWALAALFVVLGALAGWGLYQRAAR